MKDGIKGASGGIFKPWALLLALVLMIMSGVAYRILASHLKIITDTPIELPVPLNAFPFEINEWMGKDVPLPQNVLNAAANDDYLNRLYINDATEHWANIYVAYTARPRTMMGHRPDICYPGRGWIKESVEQTEFVSSSGDTVKCLLFCFRQPEPSREVNVVLNYYIINGQIMADDSAFISGLSWRTPNIAGDPARYVTQIQISSILESSVRELAIDIADQLKKYFPDKDGVVKVAEKENLTLQP